MHSNRKAVFVVGIACSLLICVAMADATTGWTPETLHYIIQSPYNLKQAERYSCDAKTDTHHFWVFNTDRPNTRSSTRPPRTEMSLDHYSSGQHQFEADVMVATNTSRVTIMQVFGGENGHATSLQLRVYDGKLKAYGDKTLLTNIYGRWFHLNVTHDVATNVIEVFINGELALTAKDYGGKSWHFKCGVYAQEKGSHKMEVYFRNIKIYKQ